MDFVHLHNHTEYSLLDGAARINDLVDKAVELGMSAIAITDHGVMYGVISFFNACKAAGIKPIIGCEIYVAARSRHDKEARRDDAAYHLILLAENQKGYENLCRIVSIGFLEGFYYKPRVDWEILEKYGEGLICLSGCVAGEIPELLLQRRKEEAYALAKKYRDYFGRDNYFIEIQNHGIPEELEILPQLIELAESLDISLVATNDLHYVNKSDAKIHDILLCVQTGKTVEDENRLRFYNDSFYLKTAAEMAELFAAHSEALENTLKIAARCNVNFNFGDLYLPLYQTPPGYTLHSYLAHLCAAGFKERYPSGSAEAEKRLQFELTTIEKMGYSGYFLIVWDLISAARKNGISVGPGRGSAAGSLISYVLGITNVDPLRYNLFFERFLNPERVSPPDIDIDICDERRGEVVDYIFNKYGYDKVSQIITFNFMGAKGAVRDVGRVLNIPYDEVDSVARLIPEKETRFDLSFKDKNRHNRDAKASELYERYKNEPKVKELLDIAAQIQGMPRHAGKHAAGVVVTQKELINYMPVQKLSDGIITTQYEKQQVEDCGLLKMDILGLRNLSVIDRAVENIREVHALEIDINNIPLDDEATYDMLSRGESICVFQLESEGLRNYLKKLKPKRIEDIIAMVALYRPGPLGGGMVDIFISNKHGITEVSYMHPLLKPVLEETYGVIVYQEQVMQIASLLAGFTLGQSDMLRRAMGKKKPEVIAREKSHFIEGCLANSLFLQGCPAGKEKILAGEIFDLMAKFADYGFNKSHSAAYAIITYQTAWLKCNYPAEFMAAMMTSVINTTDKVPECIEECGRLNIEILPPDINESEVKFVVTEGKIRFPLAAVKNVGKDAVKLMVAERQKNGAFTSMGDFCCRLQLNRKALESLIKCGCFDSLGERRSQLLEAVDRALALSRRLNEDKMSNQLSLFDFGMGQTENAAPLLELKDIPEFSESELLAHEKEYIGFYISGHPLDSYAEYFKKKTSHNTFTLNEDESLQSVSLGGMITGFNERLTRGNTLMAIFNLEDKYGFTRCVVFPRVYAKIKDMLADDRVCIISGKVKSGSERAEIVVEKAEIPCKVYLRLPDSNDGACAEKIKDMLAVCPGDGELKIYYENLRQYSSLDGFYGIMPSKRVLANLKDFLGAENVVVK